MKYNLRKGLYLLMAILCVGWVQAQETISNPTELKNAINSAEENGTVTLTGNIENVMQAITISRALTLNGNGYTISGSVPNGALLEITGTEAVTIKDLTVVNTVGSNDEDLVKDIRVAQSGTTDSQVTLDGVTLGGNGLVGLAIDGSKVTIKNVIEKATHSRSAITLDKNQAPSPETTPYLTIEEGNKFNCLLEINGLLEDEEDLSQWVNTGNSGFVYFGMGYTDRYNSTTKTYTIPSAAEGRTEEINSYELVLLATCLQDIEKIVLGTGSFDLSYLEGSFSISKSITIEGAVQDDGTPATTLLRGIDWSDTDNDTKHMVNITASNVTLKNLVIDGDKKKTGASPEGSGINVYKATNVTIENVISKNNLGSGLIVNGSNVTIKDFHTEGNGYGINLDNGENVTGTPTLTIKGFCSVAEESKIFGPASLLTASSVTAEAGWASATVTIQGTEYRVWTDKLITTIGNEVYANGYPITITASESEDKVRIFRTDYETDYIEVDGASATIYGGSRNASVESTSITVAGGSLIQIYGGGNAITQEASVTGNVTINMTAGTVPYVSGGGNGNSTSSRADVKGKTTINISGGEISGILAAGGDYYAKSGEVTMTVSGSETSLGWVLGGGYDAGNTTNELKTEFDQSVNGTSKTTISITDASAQYICAGGGQGYSYSKEVEATLNNVKISGGLLGTGSNGRSDKVIIKASNCDFTPTVSYTKEIAAINRGYVTNSVKMVFENCKFPTENLAVYACATLAWQDGSYPIPTTPNTEMVFTNCENTPTVGISEGLQNFTLTGANAKIAPFTRNSNNTITAFEIPSGKTWTFNNGLEMTPEITLTNNGTLAVENGCTVATSQQLNTVLAENTSIVFIDLAEHIFAEDFTVSKAQVINGNKKATITGTVTMQAGRLENVKLLPSTGEKAVIVENNAEIHHNYWGTDPNFADLITTDPSEATPYPYYSDEDMTKTVDNIKIITSTVELSGLFDGGILDIKAGGHAILKQDGVVFESVNIEEGGQLTPDYGENKERPAKAEKFVFNPTLVAGKWKAVGTPFKSTLIETKQGLGATLAQETANTGVWFATLKDDHTPEIVVSTEAVENNAGLWAATGEQGYAFKAEEVYLENTTNPEFSLDGDAKLQMCVNPNTHEFTTNETIYVLDAEKNVFVRTEGATLAPFQSFVIADANTTATLRSIGTTDPNATGNEFVVKEGYYLTTERGAIVVHTAEPMELYVVAVSGAVVYRGTVTDGERIAVPTGFYAVNGQMVRVK